MWLWIFIGWLFLGLAVNLIMRSQDCSQEEKIIEEHNHNAIQLWQLQQNAKKLQEEIYRIEETVIFGKQELLARHKKELERTNNMIAHLQEKGQTLQLEMDKAQEKMRKKGKTQTGIVIFVVTVFCIPLLYVLYWFWYYFCAGFLVIMEPDWCMKILYAFLTLIGVGFWTGLIMILFGWNPWK